MSDDTPVVHIDMDTHAEIFNKAFDLIAPLCTLATDNDVMCDVAEDIFSLVREYAPLIMEAAHGQAIAERVITAAVWAQFGTGEETQP